MWQRSPTSLRLIVMREDLRAFGRVAHGLAKNPLGIIALFIVLVYGFAALVTTLSSTLSSEERQPLIWFLVLFPVLVLAVFGWLVSRHASKLYGPADYKDEENYVRMQIAAGASLAAATTKRPGPDAQEPDFSQIADAVRAATPVEQRSLQSWQKKILWVDDIQQNTVYERRAFEALGLSFRLARSTSEALELLERNRFGAIISDMGRKEGPREGYVLLDAIRGDGDETPFFIYSSSNLPEHKREAERRGAQGSTNDPEELFRLVTAKLMPAAAG